MMSTFLERMLERTLKSSAAVRPVVTPILASEVNTRTGHSMTPSSDEGIRDMPQEGESSDQPGTEALAPTAAPVAAISARNERTVPDSSTFSRKSAESQIASRRDNFMEAEEMSGEQSPSSGENVERDIPEQPFEPDNHSHSGSEEVMPRIVGRIEIPQKSGPPSRRNPDGPEPSSQIRANRNPAPAVKKAATDTSFSSHINADGGVMTQGGVSDVVGQSDKHDRGKTRSHDFDPWSKKSLKSVSSVKDLKGANKENLLVSSDSRPHSRPEASSGLQQKGFPAEKGVHSGKDISSAAPAVKVTIGRIEVRTVTQQTPRQRRRVTPAQPRLSLADYLKRRDGGLQ